MNGAILLRATRFVVSAAPDFQWLKGGKIADRAAFFAMVKAARAEAPTTA
jgi:hypothetical protein